MDSNYDTKGLRPVYIGSVCLLAYTSIWSLCHGALRQYSFEDTRQNRRRRRTRLYRQIAAAVQIGNAACIIEAHSRAPTD